ncbi:unnamed protein product [Sphagnum jensenii]|uniref:Aldehyde dehydrogenase domain-containing protein n=1 Tax=Sphagnum jensenii TaxID=128206 RepID=A0ABP1A3X9_9BRYO
MAITTAVFLKDSRSYEQGLESMASKVRVIAGTESGGGLGPAISKQAKEHAKLVLDGWGIKPNSLPDAIQLVNSNKYGNGTAIFTTSAGVASTFPHEIDDGKVGINIPIPMPLAFFSITGSRPSFAGDLNFYGRLLFTSLHRSRRSHHNGTTVTSKVCLWYSPLHKRCEG